LKYSAIVFIQKAQTIFLIAGMGPENKDSPVWVVPCRFERGLTGGTGFLGRTWVLVAEAPTFDETFAEPLELCRQACPTLTRFFEDQDAALSGRLIRTPRKTNTVAATRYVFERFNFHPTSVQVSTKIVKSSDSLSGESARSAMSSTYLVNLKPRDRSRMSSGFKIKSNK